MKLRFILCIAVFACAAPTTKADDEIDAKKAMEAFAAMAKSLTSDNANPLAALGASNQPATDFRQLKALLPEKIVGLRRTSAKGEKNGSLGVNISSATGEYGGENDAYLSVKITDIGAMGPLATFSSFVTNEVDSESDDGYERTTEYGKYKGLEKYNTQSKSGSISLTVAKRFTIEIDGSNIDPKQLQSAVLALNLDELEAIANQPPPTTNQK